MNSSSFVRPLTALRRARAKNLVLVPGDLLPHIAQWQFLANRLPERGVLIVLPAGLPIQTKTLLSVARILADGSRDVRVMHAGCGGDPLQAT
jgi:hypothetical protein